MNASGVGGSACGQAGVRTKAKRGDKGGSLAATSNDGPALLCIQPTPESLFVGTSEARLFTLEDDGLEEDEFFAEAPGLRDRMFLATKGGIIPGVPYDSSAPYLASAIDASLRRLRTDRVELWQLAPLVLHAIKFGGGYVGAVEQAVGRYA